MSYPTVTCICATYNRHYHLERMVKFFLDQEYPGDHLLLIYNNNKIPQELAPIKLPLNKRIALVNNHLDYRTGKGYDNLGAIYRDALTHVPKNTEVISHWDDDDIYLPYHLLEGVNGYTKARVRGKKAYKPESSYFRDATGKTHLTSNTMEPSIFVSAEHLFKYGYKETTTDQHFGWLNPLLENDELFVYAKGVPSFVYTWQGDVWKTSGSNAVDNFSNCRNFKQGTTGDGIITPITKQEAQQYYEL
jgi:hypothetical protein